MENQRPDNSSSEHLIPRLPAIQGTTFPRHFPLKTSYLQAPYLQLAFLVPLYLFITMIS